MKGRRDNKGKGKRSGSTGKTPSLSDIKKVIEQIHDLPYDATIGVARGALTPAGKKKLANTIKKGVSSAGKVFSAPTKARKAITKAVKKKSTSKKSTPKKKTSGKKDYII